MKKIGLKVLVKINDQGETRKKGSEFEVSEKRYKEIQNILGEKTDLYLEIQYIKK